MYRMNFVKELIKWIQNNLEQPLSINIVASKSGYSPWHLQRLFKEQTGDSLAKYIRKERLQNAASDLVSTSRSIADIACQYQFDSHQSFSRAFKKMFSVTPTSYRKKR